MKSDYTVKAVNNNDFICLYMFGTWNQLRLLYFPVIYHGLLTLRAEY